MAERLDDMGDVNITTSTNFIFKLSDPELKNLEFRVQSFAGLGLTISETMEYYGSQQIVRPGDSMIWNELQLEVLLDQQLNIFEQLYNYLQQMKDWENNTLNRNINNTTGVLYTTDNRNHFSKKFIFHQAWIKSFTDLSFNSMDTSPIPLTTTLAISYQYYSIEDAEG